MKVIDHLIEPALFNQFARVILEAKFPWFFVNGKSELQDGLYQFSHLFVDDGGKIILNYLKILL